ncbi:hypothetical protein AVEN_148698-1 [Araneus ventricosus]|uniref:Uncharacterized protein n=1 Tax=Araneus ventricosus TaxID=182803 RepID=A0A4Y2FPP5_ARAVE|nr:hypothetical protein AVEN_148698-1 [Araneus ventricosus]
MTRYIHSPSLKARLVARVLDRGQACSSTVQDGGNAGEEFLCVGMCEAFFGYERSACIPKQIRKSCTWSFVVCTRNLIRGPRWPGDKVSALGPVDFRSETRLYQRSSIMHMDLVSVTFHLEGQLTFRWSRGGLEIVMLTHVSLPSSEHGLNLRCPSQNNLRAATNGTLI